MKTCPFCAEEIQNQAIKCKHCGEFLDASYRPGDSAQTMPWYFRKAFIILALCGVGPLALPLIWWHPAMRRAWKIGLTLAILVLSWILMQVTIESFNAFKAYFQLLDEL